MPTRTTTNHGIITHGIATKWGLCGLHCVAVPNSHATRNLVNAHAVDLSDEFVLNLAQLPAGERQQWRPFACSLDGQDSVQRLDNRTELLRYCQQLLARRIDVHSRENIEARSSIIIPMHCDSLPAWLRQRLTADIQVAESNITFGLLLTFIPVPIALKQNITMLARLSQVLPKQTYSATEPSDPLADVWQGQLTNDNELAPCLFNLLQSLKQRQLQQRYWYGKIHQSRQAQLTITDLAPVDHATLVFEQGNKTATPWPLLCAAPSTSEQLIWQVFWPISAQNTAELTATLKHILALPISQRYQLMLADIKAYQQQQAATKTNSPASCLTVLVAPDASVLDNEIHQLLHGLVQGTEAKVIQTPSGSVVRQVKDNQQASFIADSVCFVYPGVGTCYPGQFHDLSRYFPRLYQALDTNGELAELLAARHFLADGQGTDKLTTLAQAGVGSAWLLSHLLQQLNITPAYAFGYSLGEVSMWAGLSLWQSPQVLGERLAKSVAFNSGITGELNAVAQLWQLTPEQEVHWASYSLRLPDGFTQNLVHYDKAWLAINHGDSGILVGDSQQCQQLLNETGVRAIKVGFVTAMHTPAAQYYGDEIAQIFHLPLSEQGQALALQASTRQPAIKLFSSANYQPVKVSSDAISQSIHDCFCQPLDFAHLTQQVYQAGARIFIEVGAGRSCCTHIDKILQHQPHVSLATNGKGQSSSRSLLRLLAQLVSLGLKPELDSLFGHHFSLSLYQQQDQSI
ncbi:PfaB family protein [Motilimonas cestriensis]|uniref:PfaB family protein n=1 Tax=Motilimonas cestriensis TaxID=2742685 RepID=A0ABS8WDN9_9GAMM|nr:PfaB family protein [Motilimonas cestriensis]MCE2597157.1 PfaB family protein [Motilimonas cestriensis]